MTGNSESSVQHSVCTNWLYGGEKNSLIVKGF